MKRIAIAISSFVLTLLFFGTSFSQSELTISGGNAVSSLVCGNQRVFVWGSNETTIGSVKTLGTLGIGSTNTIETTPKKVTFPGGDPVIRQVNSGSGAHFVAVDCNNNAWAWGGNEFGQIGTGSNGNVVTTPTRVSVVGGDLAGNAVNGIGGFLTGVSVVYAGNSNSFAILNDSRLVAWGKNSDEALGQLGNGTNTNSNAPVFVKSSVTAFGQTAGQPLVGVIKVFAGDNIGMALIDVDGDGIGVIFTWGNGVNGSLGRKANNSIPNATENGLESSNLAGPVRRSDGTYLDEIIQISCGDVFGMAHDLDGTIWSWGNGGWGGCTGTEIFTLSHLAPRRVLSGAAAGSADEVMIGGKGYLLASFIGAGQGYAMAVTQNGKPMAWGNNGGSPGGVLGNGGGASQPMPVFIINNATNAVDNNVILINRGDTWGFYVNDNNEYFAWGWNGAGVLGDGTTDTKNKAVKVTLPSGCDLPDIEPKANITPGSEKVCASKFTPVVLNSGFAISNLTQAAKYDVKWFRNNIQQGTTQNANTGSTFTATTPGTYKVTIKFTGTCMANDFAESEIKIDTFPRTFTVPLFNASPRYQAYCSDTAYVKVNSTLSTNAVYQYFATSTSTAVLGTSTGSNVGKLYLPTTIPNKGSGDVTLYVEEKGPVSGIVYKRSQSCATNWAKDENIGSPIGNPNQQSGFTVFQNTTFTEFKIELGYDIQGNQTLSGSVPLAIYGSRINNGNLVADENNKIGDVNVPFTVTNSTSNFSASNRVILTSAPFAIPVTGSASGTTYFFSLRKGATFTYTGNGGNFKLYMADCTPVGIPIRDDVSGSGPYVTYSHMSGQFGNGMTGANFKGSYVYDVKFRTSQEYCNRVPVTVKQACPCAKPTAVTITPNFNFVEVCAGTNSTALTGAFTASSDPIQSGGAMRYVWYKKGASPVDADYANTPIAAAGKTITNLTASETWVLRVEDYKTAPNTSCATEDTLQIRVKATPTVINIPNVTACKGASGIAIDTSLNTTNRLVWYTADAPSTAGRTFTRPSVDASNAPLTTTYYVGFVSKTTPACESATRDRVDVVINDNPILPTSSVANPVVYCQGATAIALSASAVSPNTLKWYGEDATGGTASSSAPTPNISAIGTKSYYVSQATVASTGVPSCESSRLKIDVTVNAAPAEPTASNPVNFCVGGSVPTFTATTTAATNSLKWYTQAANGTSSATAPPINSTTPLTQKAWVSQVSNAASGSCEGARKELTVTLDPVTTITTEPVASQTLCEGQNFTISATAGGTGPFTYQLQKNNVDTLVASATNSFTINNIVASNAGTYKIIAKGKCGDKSSVNAVLVVNTKPRITTQPAPTANDCAGGAVSLKVVATGTAPLTYEWIKNGTPVTGTDEKFLSPIQLSDAGTYKVRIKNVCNTVGIESTESVVQVTDKVEPKIDLVTVSDIEQCGGGTAKVSLQALPGGGGNAPGPRYAFSVSLNGGASTVVATADSSVDKVDFALPSNTTGLVQKYLFTAKMRSTSGCIATGFKNVVEDTLSVKVDPIVTAAMADIVENKTVICDAKRALSLSTALPVNYKSGVWSSDAGVVAIKLTPTTAEISGIDKNSKTLTRYTVTSPLGKCPTVFDTVTTVRAGDMTEPQPKADKAGRYCVTEKAIITGATPVPPIETGTWAPAEPNVTFNPSTGEATFSAAGRYKFKYTISNGGICKEKVDSIYVDVDAEPSQPVITTNTGNTITMCGTEQQLSVDPSGLVGTLKWTNDKGLIFTDDISGRADTLATTKAKTFSQTTGTAKFKVSVTNGACTKPKSDSILVIRSGDLLEPNLTASTLTVCKDGAIDMLGNDAKLGTNSEHSGWKWTPTANVKVDTTGADDNSAKFTFSAVGSFDITYRITNATCPPKTEVKTITVIEPPVGNINTPASSPISYRDNDYILKADPLTSDYRGQWLADSVGVLFGDTTTNTVGLRIPTFDNTKTIQWVVRDVNRVCPKDVKTVVITRKDFTVANIEPNKNVCIVPTSNFTLKGNSFTALTETASWTVKSGNASVNMDLSDNSKATFVPNGGAGEYEFYYTIVNSTLNKTTKDSIKVRVDAASAVPTISLLNGPYDTAPTAYKICATDFTLPGVASSQGTLSRNWWEKVVGTGDITPSNLTDSVATPTLKSISGVVELKYMQKNGVCPAEEISFFINKVGNISMPKISITGGKSDLISKKYNNDSVTAEIPADTLCLGGTYTITGTKLPTETGVWSVSGSSVSLSNDLTNPSQSIVVNSASLIPTKLKWSITNGVCPTPNTIEVNLIVHDIPTKPGIVGNPVACEGVDTLFKVSPASTSTLPVTYTWSNGTSGAARSGSAIGTESKYKFSSDATGLVTSGSFDVTPINRCGAGLLETKTVDIKLAPRKFKTGDDVISGPTTFCATSTGVKYKLNDVQPPAAADGYVWKWGSDDLGDKDTSALVIGKWSIVESSTAVVTVELTNQCSESAIANGISRVISKPLNVTITKPEPLGVTIESNRLDSIFCVPQTQLVFTAKPVTNLSNVVATYEFSVDGSLAQVASASTTFTPAIGAISDSSIVSVKINVADITQCLTTFSNDDDIVMQGFNFPDSTIISPAILKICGDGDRIELSVNRTKNRKNFYNDKSISWFRDGKLVAIDSSNTKSYKLVLSQPSETGVYSVKLNRNVCADSSESIVANNPNVVIYEKPVLGFAVDPLIIIYREGIVVPVPAYVTPPKMKDSKFVYSYRNGDTTWLRNPDSLRALIVPTREQKEWYYNLVVTNGDTSIPTSVCRTAGDIRVINSLPLMIPNAFSPNGDGLNDTWVINGLIKFTDVKVSVFNRWGNRVFYDTNGYKTPWDGNVNGVPLATGTYYAIIELSGSTDNSDENITRSLTIVR